MAASAKVRGGGDGLVRVLVLLAGAGILLVVFQYATLGKFAVLSPGAGYVSWSEFWQRVAAAVRLSWTDAALALLIGGMGLGLVGLEWRRGEVTRLGQALLASESRALLSLFISCLLGVRYYFASGQLAWGGDAAEHIFYAQLTAESFAAGEWPIWTNALAGGSPFLQFYGFLFFYAVGAIDLVVNDIFNSIKLVAGLAHALSGPAMYLLVRTATRSRSAGWVAGLAYVLCFWHAQQIAVMGRWPLSLFYLLLPLPFYAFEIGRLTAYRLPAILAGGWALAALAFTHPGYAAWAMVFFAAYIAARSLGWHRRRRRDWLVVGGAIALLGLATGAYLTLPMWLERGHTGLAAGVSLSGVPDPGWRQLFLWSNFRWRFDQLPLDQQHWYGGYLGISLWMLALGGWWAHRRQPGEVVWIAGAGLAAAMVLVLGYRWVEWLPMVSSLNAGRYLLFATFFLAYGAGVGLRAVGQMPRMRRSGGRLATAAIAFIAVDLGTTTFQQPYLKRSDPSPVGYPVDLVAEFADITGRLPAGQYPGFRLHPTTEKVHPFSAIGWLGFATGIPQMHSLFLEAPHAQRQLHEPWRRMFDGELDRIEQGGALLDHPDYEFIYGGARMLNLRYALTQLPQPAGEPSRHTRLGWPDNTPLLVAGKTLPFPAEEFARARESGDLEQMVRASFPERADIDLLKEMFPALWIIRITAPFGDGLGSDVIVLTGEGPARDLGTSPKAKVWSHQVENQRVMLDVEVDAACFARLAYAHYPYLKVLVNGGEVATWPTAGGFIALELAAGRHQIELVPYLSPLRKAMLGLLAAMVIGTGGLLWGYKVRWSGRN